ncbi:MAG: type II toxin-antitoxin system HicB family antitoxin [Minisyncoccia bacterium]|jgi:predicted RNase H-like HicB family nuclease
MDQKKLLEINKLRGLFPKVLEVGIKRSENGGFVAAIKTLPGCATQADSFSELIEMVNDAARTYFEIPQKLSPYMPTYLPPLKVAQAFDLFPVAKQRTEIKLQLPNSREALAR